MRRRDHETTMPSVAGVLSVTDVAATADAIAAQQTREGLILWFEGGHADPWNHVEAAMALDVAGRGDDAARAYQWLADRQLPTGAWHHYYLADGIEDPKVDSNVVAYVATGVWHHWLVTGDRGFLEAMWPVVDRAIAFVLDLQTPRGEVIWARHADGTPWSFALLTGSSSIVHSLRCAIAIAEAMGEERPDWELSAARLAHVIATEPEAFAPKHRWAMDWYYPVLCGAIDGERGRRHLARRWDTFAMEGRGIRCVADRPWITAAETCECSMAHVAAGDEATALDLFTWAQRLRDGDGAYFTGIVYPEEIHFPGGERSTYTAAAVLLAADALSGATPAAGLFRGETIPELIRYGETTEPDTTAVVGDDDVDPDVDPDLVPD